eukprot:CAMPEP_0205810786 /NCGR_PEP_ID=MMETSP0205-20121125/14953_1 /ASSEMBLY_ACC=CAM_ASM_000278 /TAXON_ID=36767 /ORGANISM="Euplotes focardii, Strain TN1" /LENGTH=222 /DNA_ID=CAMNT_0053089239 /DNA_START=24 /DNA_END=692 /DNA_ORIENTATION=+
MAKLKHKSKNEKNLRDETEFTDEVLRIDFRRDWCRKLLEEISVKHRLGAIPTLALRYLPQAQDLVPEFLTLCVDEIDHLFINNYVETEVKKDQLEIEPYFTAITSVAPKVKESIWVEHFKMTAREVAQIIRKTSHLKSIRLENCLIDFSDVKEKPSGGKAITLQTENDSNVEYLALKNCELTNDHLSIIANSVKDLPNLKSLDISGNEITIEEANELLEGQG